MDETRRKFLKMAGLSAMAGMAAPAAVNMLINGEVQAGHGTGHDTQADSDHGAKASKPTGKRYGMVIDMRKFEADKSLAQKVIDACHQTHNVPDYGNPKDEIKWIWKEQYNNAFPEHSHYKKNKSLESLPFLVTCNHCDEPPCVKACPTQATFKSKSGAVIMDFHRCIGCRFCMAACPYGARSFNWRSPREKENGKFKYIKDLNPKFPTRMRGVVEKCNFCAERVGFGKQPACVEACGNTEALIFGDMNDPDSEISKALASSYTIQRKPALGTKPSVFYII
jgi:molybdopterin-containing oxidoreductase family iron-sulfur binding subunit